MEVPGPTTRRPAWSVRGWCPAGQGGGTAEFFFGLVGSVLMVKDFRVLALMDGGETRCRRNSDRGATSPRAVGTTVMRRCTSGR